jgi:hypothetical protein
MFQCQIGFHDGELLKLSEKLKSKAYDTNSRGCHLWQGATDVQGYPRMRVTLMDKSGHVHKQTVLVPRLILFLASNRDPIPNDVQASHLCHTKQCININHFVLEPPFMNNIRKQCDRIQQCVGHGVYARCIFA